MKMTFQRIVSVMLSGLLLTSVATPPARAGDEEWATAGKILTGVAVFGVLNHLLRPEPAYYVEQPSVVYVEKPVYVYAPPPVAVYAPPAPPPAPVTQQPQAYMPAPPPPPPQEAPVVAPQAYVETPKIRYEIRYFEGRRLEDCPRVYFSNPRYVPREIIVPYGSASGMRLYQPGVRGHVAYVQQWSSPERAWVTVGRHPCLW